MDGDYKQNYYSLTATGKYKIGHESFPLLKYIANYDKYYGIMKYFDSKCSICNILIRNEIPCW